MKLPVLTLQGLVLQIYTGLNTQTLCVLPTDYLFMCFIWISHKQRLVTHITVSERYFITETECLQRGTNWNFKCNLG